MPTPPAAHRAAVDLAHVREEWRALLAAIEQPPAAEWPPRESRGMLDQLAATSRAQAAPHPADDEPARPHPVEQRAPLVLREHPAPVNLDALDAALDIERDLFELADQVAEYVQRPIRPDRDARGRYISDQADRADPSRWHYQSPTSPGSRAYGLQWAALWLEGRVLGEGTVTPRPSNTVHEALFRPAPPLLVDRAAAVAGKARVRLDRALGGEQRATALDDPCPWCAGRLLARTVAGETAVTCSTGEGCGAPVLLDERRRRAWHGAELVGLWAALDARRRGVEPAAA
ncbi:hypothetical protein ACXZ65_33900 [Streptomyces aculeolatus]